MEKGPTETRPTPFWDERMAAGADDPRRNSLPPNKKLNVVCITRRLGSVKLFGRPGGIRREW